MNIKSTAAILLGLVLGAPAIAEVATTNDLHKQCEGKSEVERAYAYWYIVGVVSTMHSFLFSHLEVGGVSEGDIAEAVCRYIDLHPETWAKEKVIGVADAVAALYSKDPSKATKKGKWAIENEPLMFAPMWIAGLVEGKAGWECGVGDQFND